MKIKKKKLIIMLALLVLVPMALALYYFQRTNFPVGNGAETRKGELRADLKQPTVVLPSDADLRRVGDSYSAAAHAVSNGEVHVLRALQSQLPSLVEHLPEKTFVGVDAPLRDLVMDKFARAQELGGEIASAREFESELTTHVEAARLWGMIQLSRKSYGGLFDSLEARVLERINRYAEKFANEGRGDLRSYVDDLRRRWIEQIESEKGFSRAVSRYWVAYVEIWGCDLMKRFSQSWEQVLDNAVKNGTWRLEAQGYVPRWKAELLETPEPKTRGKTSDRQMQVRDGDGIRSGLGQEGAK